MEGVRNGLPFLTWPYFADQFINESYVCDVWKTGLRLVKDAGGVVVSEHIAACIEDLLNDLATVSRALELQKVASSSIGKDGTSFNNLTAVINAMKG
jgi:UDP:flavonoid glycosyltransferase YjiC (YdhE family)